MVSRRALHSGLILALALSAVACGGGGGGGQAVSPPPPPPPPANNVASVIIDQGPSNASVNTMFASVTVCLPGSTTNCQTIDHIQVDTGSYGLRILAPVLTLTLPVETLTGGGSLRFTNIPANCSSTGKPEDTVASFGANGILGVGPFELDCGDCDTVIRGFYYSCAATCSETTVPTNLQVANPVTRFPTDKNGVIVVLPSVAAGGAANVGGSLIFGIDTQSNNQSGTQTVLTLDGNAELLIMFNGQALANSFIDSGSNGIYFTDSSLSKCVAPPNDPSSLIVNFYCPPNTLTLGLSMQGMNGVMANNLTFGVGNAQTMFNSNFDAFPQLAGTIPTTGSFDYGLAFFYGKRVAVAVEGNTTSVGTGPYIAF